MNVGVTATAKGLTRTQELVLASMLADLRTDDVDWLLHGCCVGGDEQLAVRARRLGYLLYGLPGRGLLDPARSLLLNDRLDPVPTTKTPELTRNRHIVAAVGVLLAGPSGYVEKKRSGTWATIRYAKAARLPLIIVYPEERKTWSLRESSLRARPETSPLRHGLRYRDTCNGRHHQPGGNHERHAHRGRTLHVRHEHAGSHRPQGLSGVGRRRRGCGR